MRVENVMGDVAFAVLERTPVTDLLAMVGRLGVGAVVVVDAERRPVGVVSTHDLLPKGRRTPLTASRVPGSPRLVPAEGGPGVVSR